MHNIVVRDSCYSSQKVSSLKVDSNSNYHCYSFADNDLKVFMPQNKAAEKNIDFSFVNSNFTCDSGFSFIADVVKKEISFEHPDKNGMQQ